MRFLKVSLGAVMLYIIFFVGFAPMNSCTKTITEHDTTIKTIHDTTIDIVHDTTIIRDTIVDTLYCLRSGMIAYYNFNGGNLNDSSGYNNNINLNTATKTADRFGRADNAYLFDGVNGYMRVPNSQSLNPSNITIMAIVKFNGFNSGVCMANTILMKGFEDQDQGTYGLRVLSGAGGCAIVLDTNAEKLLGYYGDYTVNSYVFGPSYAIHTNTWITMVYTYDGYTHNLYINGDLINSNTNTAQFNPNTQDLNIGRTENPSFYYPFSGVMDEIRIYNRALNSSEVKQFNKLMR